MINLLTSKRQVKKEVKMSQKWLAEIANASAGLSFQVLIHLYP